jgi:hypothetical protein
VTRIITKLGKSVSVLLIILLIGAQTGALAHSYKHDPGSVQEATCASCATAGQLSSACLDSGFCSEICAFHSSLEADQHLPTDSIHSFAARQRGPPDLF